MNFKHYFTIIFSGSYILISPAAFGWSYAPQNVTSGTSTVSSDNSGQGVIDQYIGIYNNGQLIWEDSGGAQANVTLTGGVGTSMGIGNDSEAYIYNSGGTATFNMSGDPFGGSWQHVIKMDTNARFIVGAKDNTGGTSTVNLEDGNIYAPGLIQVNKMGVLNLKTTAALTTYPGAIYVFDTGRLENSGNITLEGANNSSAEFRAVLSLANDATYQGWTNDPSQGYGSITLKAYSDLVNLARGDRTSDIWRNITVTNNNAGEAARILNYNNGETWMTGNGSWTTGDSATFEKYTLDATAGYTTLEMRDQGIYVAKGAMWDQKTDGLDARRIEFNLSGSKLIVEDGGWFRTQATVNNGGAIIVRPNSRFSFGPGAVYSPGVNVADQQYYYNWGVNTVGGYNNGWGEFIYEGDSNTIIDIGSSDDSMWRTFLRDGFVNNGSLYLRANMNPQKNMYISNQGYVSVADGATLTIDSSVGASEFVVDGGGLFNIGNIIPLTPYDVSAAGTVEVKNGAVLVAPQFAMGTGTTASQATLNLDAGNVKTSTADLDNNSMVSMINGSSFNFGSLNVRANAAANTVIAISSGSQMSGDSANINTSTLNVDGANSSFNVNTLNLGNAAASTISNGGLLNAPLLSVSGGTSVAVTSGGTLRTDNFYLDASALAASTGAQVNFNSLNATGSSPASNVITISSGSQMTGTTANISSSTLNIDGASSAFNADVITLNASLSTVSNSGLLNAPQLLMSGASSATVSSNGTLRADNLAIDSSSVLTNAAGNVQGVNLTMRNGAQFISTGALVFGGSPLASGGGNSYFSTSGTILGPASRLRANGITINTGSSLAVDPRGNFATTVELNSHNHDINVHGTLTGSAIVNMGTGNMRIKSGGLLLLEAEDGMTLDNDIYFENGSTYYASINTRAIGAMDDIQSQIKARESFFGKSAVVSVGANQRPELISKKYAILVTNQDHNGDSLNIANNLSLRTSLLTGYRAEWVFETSGPYANKHVLYIDVVPRVVQVNIGGGTVVPITVTPKTLASTSGFTVNEQNVGGAFEGLNHSYSLSPELDKLLDYTYTQVTDINEFEKILRDTALTTYANYLYSTPQISRNLGNAVDNRLANLRRQRYNTSSQSSSNSFGDHTLWIASADSNSTMLTMTDADSNGYRANSFNHQKNFNAFVMPSVSSAKQRQRNEQGYKTKSYGISLGIDTEYKDFIYGVSLGYANTKLEAQRTDQTIKSDAFQLGLYGKLIKDNWFVASKASYSHLRNRSSMTYINLMPGYSANANARYRSQALAADVQVGYNYKVNNFTFTPSAGIDLVYAKQKGFTEKNARSLNRRLLGQSYTSVEAQARIEASHSNQFNNNKVLNTLVYAEYGHEIKDPIATVSGEFINTGIFYQGNSVDVGRDRFSLGLAVELLLNEKVATSLYYNWDSKKGYKNNSVGFKLEYKF